MPLEFALRPHFDLDRPVRRRRVVRSRFLRFAVPTAAYWLAIAGATYAFVGNAREHSPGEDAASRTDADYTPVYTPPRSAALPPSTPSVSAPAADAESTSEPAPLPPPESAPLVASLPAVAAQPGIQPDVPSIQRDLPQPTIQPNLPTSSLPAPLPRPAPPTAPDPFAAPEPFAALRTDAADERRERAPAIAAADGHERAQNEARAASLPSCESASAGANQTIEVGAAPGAPDLTRDAFASVLEDGSYLNQCSVPARTALDICAAVQNGKVVGLTVTSEPRSPGINACVRRAVTALRFPHSVRLDITRTRFAPSR